MSMRFSRVHLEQLVYWALSQIHHLLFLLKPTLQSPSIQKVWLLEII